MRVVADPGREIVVDDVAAERLDPSTVMLLVNDPACGRGAAAVFGEEEGMVFLRGLAAIYGCEVVDVS